MSHSNSEDESERSDSSIDESTWMNYKREGTVEKEVDEVNLDEDDIWLQRKMLQRQLQQREGIVGQINTDSNNIKVFNRNSSEKNGPMTPNDMFSEIRKRDIYSKDSVDALNLPGENVDASGNYMPVGETDDEKIVGDILKDIKSINYSGIEKRDKRKKIKVDKIEVVEGQSGNIDYYCFTKECSASSNSSMNLSVIKLEDGRHYVRMDQHMIELSDLMYFKSLKPQSLDPKCLYEDDRYAIYDDADKIEIVLNSGDSIKINCDILIFERIISTLNRYYNKTASKFI